MIGVQIGRYGDGLMLEPLQVNKHAIFRYKVGRTHLFELLLRAMNEDKVRFVDGEESLRAYEQLMALLVEYKQTGIRYNCLPGRHDDLAISLALLEWASRHPHLNEWCRCLEPRPKRIYQPTMPVGAWT